MLERLAMPWSRSASHWIQQQLQLLVLKFQNKPCLLDLKFWKLLIFSAQRLTRLIQTILHSRSIWIKIWDFKVIGISSCQSPLVQSVKVPWWAETYKRIQPKQEQAMFLPASKIFMSHFGMEVQNKTKNGCQIPLWHHREISDLSILKQS